MLDIRPQLKDSYVLISCEGGAEDTVIHMLLDDDRFIFNKDAVINITRLRKACDIERQFLGFEYDQPVSLLRVVDSLNAKFELGALYRDACSVYRICTRPDIEILTIINEDKYDDYCGKRMKPNVYCKQCLGMSDIKRPDFLTGYWDIENLVRAIRTYARIHRTEPGEYTLADILT